MTRAFALALLLTLLGCATNAPPKSDSMSAPGADIPAYKTFGWMTPTAQTPTTILDTNITDAIRAQLVAKGYVETDTAPDFRVAFDVSAYDAKKKSSPMRIGIGVGSWGGNVGGSVGTSVPVGGSDSAASESRLTIRAVDAASNKEVWIGTTTGDIKQGLDQKAVTRAVASTMQTFPPRRPG
jgi:Domain of unknown function (DUF4136)